LMLQAKLLRVLQEQEIDRVGGLKPIKIDARIIATTNRRLLDQVRAGNFREDLYYRLNVVPLELPPLRERVGDVVLLAEHFCQTYAQEMLDGSVSLSSAAIDVLTKHRWPGNVRELENVIQRAVALSQNSVIEPGDLMLTALSGFSTNSLANRFEPTDLTMDDAERELIFRTLAELDGNRTHTARKLGISLRTLRNRLRDYRDQGINVPPPTVKILPTGNSLSA
jgi:two-component system response regulator FlrC